VGTGPRSALPLFLFHPMVASESRIGSRPSFVAMGLAGGLTLHTDDPRCSVSGQGSVGPRSELGTDRYGVALVGVALMASSQTIEGATSEVSGRFAWCGTNHVP